MGNKRFTVSYMPPNGYRGFSDPCVRFGGKWLKDFGFNVGDKVELIQGKNMLVLVKVPDDAGPSALPARTGGVRLAY